MHIGHINCGTLRPLGGRLVNGERFPLLSARMVCHCLVIESDRGLVLVDTGFGLTDIERLRRRRPVLRGRFGAESAGAETRQLVRSVYSKRVIRAALDADEAAVRQLARLGHSPDDVSDIVLTHLDLDHAGGLADFSGARVHVDAAEHSAAMSAATAPVTLAHRLRYWPYQWAHRPQWVLYGHDGGDRWLGFEGVRELRDLPDIALVPLPGHSPGHSGVVVRTGSGESGRPSWLLHAGDAYFDHREVDAAAPRTTPGLAAFQGRFQEDAAARRDSRSRLRDLATTHGDQVTTLCSHDPAEFERFRPATAA